ACLDGEAAEDGVRGDRAEVVCFGECVVATGPVAAVDDGIRRVDRKAVTRNGRLAVADDSNRVRSRSQAGGAHRRAPRPGQRVSARVIDAEAERADARVVREYDAA